MIVTKMDLKILVEVLVLHGEVDGALEALVACVNYLLRKPIQCLLHIQIVIWVVKVIVTEP